MSSVIKVIDPVNTSAGPESNGTYEFIIAPTGKGGRGFALEQVPWEPSDGLDEFRVPLHPWDGGLNIDRLRPNARTYAQGNCDTSNSGMLLWPPKLNAVTATNLATPVKIVNFDSKLFMVGGRYVYHYDPTTNLATEDKDLGSGKSAVDAAVFNNQLVVAMGESEKIWTRSTGTTAAATWTQAGDNTFAIALGVVDNLLWRAETVNRISNCTTAPRTLTSWAPASPNQYYCGDTSFAVHTIIDYGGIPWVGKGDGMYAPDPAGKFKNQTPQIRQWPHADNARGTFTAWGFLWVPSSRGLYRIKPGQAIVAGPEVTGRPDYRFWVRGGVEFGDSIWLLCNDQGGVDNLCVVRMMRDPEEFSGRQYRFFEGPRLNGAATGRCIGATTAGTNPQILWVHATAAVRYFLLGRGSGKDVDDANYAFGTAMELETGPVQMGPDLTVVSQPVGVTTVCDISRANESLTISARIDATADSASYTDLLNTQEGGGSAAISGTSGYEAVTRYFSPNTNGQFAEVKFAGTLSSATGVTRPCIREAWLWGYSHPRMTDVISIAVDAQDRGLTHTGLDREEITRIWRKWRDQGTEVTIVFDDYEPGRTTRFIVRKVEEAEANATRGNAANVEASSIVRVQLLRVSHAADVYAT